ncbi:MAG TPA: hypothetical protein VK843_22770 [Planctomycetota bacterium]|nr:hypothetical protein [Planctomycetota bacterium]
MLFQDIRAQGSEGLFALDYPWGARLVELDPHTGVVVRQLNYSQHPVTETKLAHDGSRVIVLGNTNWLADRLIRVHPADGQSAHLPSIGAPWRIICVDFDPVSMTMHGICVDWQGGTGHYCCTLDPVTGGFSLGPPLSPAANGPTALAVSPQGVTILATASGPKLYQLDMATGSVIYLGNMSVPTSVPDDLAFNGAGQLWATLEDVYTGADTGLYTLDPGNFVASRVLATSRPYFGLAFGSKTASQPYCGAKISSLACSPSLHADGIASPVAVSGFTITADNLNNNRAGLLLYSSSGRATIPFQGGQLCIQPPLSRSTAATTGGTPLPALDCSGTWSIDYNALVWNRYHFVQSAKATTAPSPFLVPGTVVQCQWWGRDPGFPPPNDSMLSNGLEFTLAP